MSNSSFSSKQYASANKRFLESMVAQFFEVNFPKFFGPEIRQRIGRQILELIEEQMPAHTHLRPGQCLWNAVSIDTRADSAKLKLVPVVLTLVDESDITALASGNSPARVAQGATARILDEAYQQGGLLSMRDIGLLTWRRGTDITDYRQAWEKRNERLLPHPGTLQDMGSCITHKTSIVVKVVYEKKPPLQVAKETKHTQPAVDRYLRDFHRVRTCYRRTPDLAFICMVTGMSQYLVKQYLDIIQQYEPCHLTGNFA
jgi:hypothetical protein